MKLVVVGGSGLTAQTGFEVWLSRAMENETHAAQAGRRP
jgi:hypothetical protein